MVRAPALPVVSSVNSMSPVTVRGDRPPPPHAHAHAHAHAQAMNGVAQPHQQQQQPHQHPAKKTPRDFIFGKVIGEGSFSTVYIAKDIHNGREVAIKVCEKKHILRQHKEEYIKREKEILNIVSNSQVPFFVKLYATFQDATRLYFVLTYAKHGELLSYINKAPARRFDATCSRFYAAEIVAALEHLKRLNVVHRDLKPENILLDENMHILITDFGSSKIMSNEDDSGDEDGRARARKNSFVGTAQYVSPELLTAKPATPSSDLWALGCIIYQMVIGEPPFQSESEFLIFRLIMDLKYKFPDEFCPITRNLIESLLVLLPENRLGAQDEVGYPSLRQHPFFDGVNFSTLQKQTPPLINSYRTNSSDNILDHYRVPDNLEPGLDEKQMSRLLGLELHESPKKGLDEKPKKKSLFSDLTPNEMSRRLKEQEETNEFHKFVDGNLILKQGYVDKRKGLFARRRMLLLTTGPHLYYVDPINMVLKGEIPWSKELSVEGKNFRIFLVHTPNRTYYLEDFTCHAESWCEAINEALQKCKQNT